MPKPIRVTDEVREQVAAEFMRSLTSMSFLDGKISFVRDFLFRKDERATISFSGKAWEKMWALVDHFETEVAWHGMVERLDDHSFHIYDIVVYPQIVSDSTADTVQEEYDRWLMSIDNDDFNAMKAQCHSHVRMGTSPSAVDLTHQGKIVAQLGDEGFYIFLIVNKRREVTVKVYDAQRNVLYETADVDILPPSQDTTISQFLSDARQKVAVETPASRSAAAKVSGGKTHQAAKGVQRGSQQGRPPYQNGAPSRRSAGGGKPVRSCPNNAFDIDDVSGFLEGVDDFDDFAFGSGYPYHQGRF